MTAKVVGDLDVMAARLAAAGCVAARAEAAAIADLAPDADTADAWVRRRQRGEPLSWITGSTLFCGRRVHVGPGVYEPRAQTEMLARRAAGLLPRGGIAVDVCTGAGAVAAHLSVDVPTAVVVGTDIDPVAARCARRNGVHTVVADIAGSLRPRRGADVVTAVAPYVPTAELRLLPADVRRHEPQSALDGGADGLVVLRQVVAAAARLLRRGGWLLVEAGGRQDRDLAASMRGAGFVEIAPWHDAEGDLRGIAAQR